MSSCCWFLFSFFLKDKCFCIIFLVWFNNWFWDGLMLAGQMLLRNCSNLHWGSWPGGGRGLSPPAAPGFESSCARLSPPRCLTCPLGLQGVQWAVELVVVRASWPGHPRKSKKKKKMCLLMKRRLQRRRTGTDGLSCCFLLPLYWRYWWFF
jgi:hypothetical protein